LIPSGKNMPYGPPLTHRGITPFTHTVESPRFEMMVSGKGGQVVLQFWTVIVIQIVSLHGVLGKNGMLVYPIRQRLCVPTDNAGNVSYVGKGPERKGNGPKLLIPLSILYFPQVAPIVLASMMIGLLLQTVTESSIPAGKPLILNHEVGVVQQFVITSVIQVVSLHGIPGKSGLVAYATRHREYVPADNVDKVSNVGKGPEMRGNGLPITAILSL